jgi:hypothetical protein
MKTTYAESARSAVINDVIAELDFLQMCHLGEGSQ